MHSFEFQFAKIALALVLFTATKTTACSQTIYQNNFDQHTAATVYTKDIWQADWSSPKWENGVEQGRVSIVSGQQAYGGTGNSLAISYPSGKFGTQNTGAQWRLELSGKHEELYSSYRIKFKTGFDFVRGGKLPGLGGGSTPTGAKKATGVNGWSGRMMWRTDFQGTPGNPAQLTSRVISYAKYANSGFNNLGEQADKKYLRDAAKNLITLKSGVWFSIAQRIKMNDPGIANGIIQIWVDNVKVFDQNDVLFRTDEKLKIDVFYFSTFFGGSNKAWATSKHETVLFDDFVVRRPNSNN